MGILLFATCLDDRLPGVPLHREPPHALGVFTKHTVGVTVRWNTSTSSLASSSADNEDAANQSVHPPEAKSQ